jgi:hypothetical protein
MTEIAGYCQRPQPDEAEMTTNIVLDLCLYMGVYETFTAATVAAECRGAGIPADRTAIQSALDQRVETGEVRILMVGASGPVYMVSDSHWRVDTPAAC